MSISNVAREWYRVGDQEEWTFSPIYIYLCKQRSNGLSHGTYLWGRSFLTTGNHSEPHPLCHTHVLSREPEST